MNNIMLDLETFGNRPGCIITAIGAVQFGGGRLGHEFYRRIDPRDAERMGLKWDADTVMWWLGNSEEARREITKPGAEPLGKALYEFGDFYQGCPTIEGKAAALWGNGSDFDNTVLAAAYDAAQYHRPWSHFQNRCYRTVKNLYRDIKITMAETARHNALEDAVAQAKHLMQMLPTI